MAYAYAGSGHAHAPATVGGAAYTYDANGNVTQEAQVGRTYTWDGRNLPTSITTAPPPPVTGTPNLIAPSRSEPVVAGSVSLVAGSRSEPVVGGTPNLTAPARGVGPQTSTVETYTYDADGQRVTRTANGSTTLYIGGIFEQDMPSNLTRSQYAFAGHLIAQRASTGAVPLIYLHGDHLGSVSAVTNGTTGAVLDRQEYGPWGNVRSGGISETTVNYTGQRRDGTGLLYYGARYYDPALGRFLSPDTMGTSLNRYTYVGNNPLNHTDPTGHCRPDECDYEKGGDNYQGGNGNGGDPGSGDNGRDDRDYVPPSIDSLINADPAFQTFAQSIGYDSSRFSVKIDSNLQKGNPIHDAVITDFIKNHPNQGWDSLAVQFTELATGAQFGYQIDLYNSKTGDVYEVKKGGYYSDDIATAGALTDLDIAFSKAGRANSGGPAGHPISGVEYKYGTNNGISDPQNLPGFPGVSYRETVPGAIIYNTPDFRPPAYPIEIEVDNSDDRARQRPVEVPVPFPVPI